jgi:hypothetical protein
VSDNFGNKTDVAKVLPHSAKKNCLLSLEAETRVLLKCSADQGPNITILVYQWPVLLMFAIIIYIIKVRFSLEHKLRL